MYDYAVALRILYRVALTAASRAKALARFRCHKYTKTNIAMAAAMVAAEGINASTVASARRINSTIVILTRKKAVLKIEKATVPTVAELTAKIFSVGVPVNRI